MFANRTQAGGDPTFATTMRVLLFRRAALQRRFPWPLRDAAEEMELHPRTLKRYVQVLSMTEHDDAGQPLIRLERRPGGLCIVSKDQRV